MNKKGGYDFVVVGKNNTSRNTIIREIDEVFDDPQLYENVERVINENIFKYFKEPENNLILYGRNDFENKPGFYAFISSIYDENNNSEKKVVTFFGKIFFGKLDKLVQKNGRKLGVKEINEIKKRTFVNEILTDKKLVKIRTIINSKFKELIVSLLILKFPTYEKFAGDFLANNDFEKNFLAGTILHDKYGIKLFRIYLKKALGNFTSVKEIDFLPKIGFLTKIYDKNYETFKAGIGSSSKNIIELEEPSFKITDTIPEDLLTIGNIVINYGMDTYTYYEVKDTGFFSILTTKNFLKVDKKDFTEKAFIRLLESGGFVKKVNMCYKLGDNPCETKNNFTISLISIKGRKERENPLNKLYKKTKLTLDEPFFEIGEIDKENNVKPISENNRYFMFCKIPIERTISIPFIVKMNYGLYSYLEKTIK